MRYRLELRKHVGADSVSRTKVCGHTCCGLASDAGFSRPIGLSLEHQQVAIAAGPANFVVFRAITTGTPDNRPFPLTGIVILLCARHSGSSVLPHAETGPEAQPG